MVAYIDQISVKCENVELFKILYFHKKKGKCLNDSYIFRNKVYFEMTFYLIYLLTYY